MRRTSRLFPRLRKATDGDEGQEEGSESGPGANAELREFSKNQLFMDATDCRDMFPNKTT